MSKGAGIPISYRGLVGNKGMYYVGWSLNSLKGVYKGFHRGAL